MRNEDNLPIVIFLIIIVALTAIIDSWFFGTCNEETPLYLRIRALVDVCEASGHYRESNGGCDRGWDRGGALREDTLLSHLDESREDLPASVPTLFPA
jgi:hypothetical protein